MLDSFIASVGSLSIRGRSTIMNDDITLKSFSNILKSNDRRVFNILMEVNKLHPLSRLSILTDEHFQKTQIAIEKDDHLSTSSKKVYKAVLKYSLPEKIYKLTSPNQTLAPQISQPTRQKPKIKATSTTNDKKAKYHGFKQEDFPPCYCDQRFYDADLDLFWCGHHMRSSVSDENIKRRARLPKHCKRCVEIHSKQEAEKKRKEDERERKRRNRKAEKEEERRRKIRDRESYRRAQVDWGKSEGIPDLFNYRY